MDHNGAESRMWPVGHAFDLGPPRSLDNLNSHKVIDVVEERRCLDIAQMLDRLDLELVALAPVKTQVRQIADFLLLDRLRSCYGLISSWPGLHMCLTGGPGTGKTTVALRMVEMLKQLGYLERGHLVTVTRHELVGQYIGHSAHKTKEVLQRALGGGLCIDDAHDLFRAENEWDYGAEACEILLQAMEDQRDELVVILAGDKDRMADFLQANPGIGSRIAHHIDFPDYAIDELCTIAERLLAEECYEFSPDGREAFRSYLRRRVNRPGFANARSVRDVLEEARLRQARRIMSGGQRRWSRHDLGRIEPEDLGSITEHN